MITFTDATRKYVLGDEEWIFGPASFSVPTGSSVCVLGQSGSGKSTLLHLLGGLDALSSGDIDVEGLNIGSFTDQEKNEYRKKYMGFVFQDFHLFNELTVFENVRLSLDIQNMFTPSHINQLVMDVLKQVGLEEKLSHLPSQLSGGQRQRVAIARAIIHKPTLLLADEPTGNLDAQTGEKIIDLLFNLHKEKGMGFWCVTHDSALAKRFDLIIRVDDGTVIV